MIDIFNLNKTRELSGDSHPLEALDDMALEQIDENTLGVFETRIGNIFMKRFNAVEYALIKKRSRVEGE